MSEGKAYHFETLQLHVGQEQPDPSTGARAVPIYMSTSYVFKDSAQASDRFALKDAGFIYSRLGDPTSDVLEKRLAALEGGVGALVTATGAAAISYTIQALCHKDDHIVAATTIYGGTYNLFAHTFIVVHSATKFIGGHGTTLGGVIVDSGKFDWAASGKFPWLVEANPSYHGLSFTRDVGAAAFVTYVRAVILRDLGATLSPFAAFMLLQGTETLSLRVERQVENALKVVDFLAHDPHVAKVNHPSLDNHPDHELYRRYFPHGGISIFTFEIKGGPEAARTFIDHLKVFSLLANVADVKSLVIHPASTTHSQMTEEELLSSGITPSTIRLSIGAEHIDDILEDLKTGFAALD